MRRILFGVLAACVFTLMINPHANMRTDSVGENMIIALNEKYPGCNCTSVPGFCGRDKCRWVCSGTTQDTECKCSCSEGLKAGSATERAPAGGLLESDQGFSPRGPAATGRRSVVPGAR